VAGKGKQRMCRICKKRPPWRYKNCPPGVCKQCYHKKVWADRPAARKERSTATGQQGIHDPAIDHEAWIMRELLGDSWEDYLVPTAEADGEQDWWISNPPF
jgi:hypothetical protein